MAEKHYIPSFISQKRGIVFFLALYAIASIIFFFVYHPLGMFGEWGGLPDRIDVQTYMMILLLVGFTILIASRVLLYNAIKKHPEWTFGNALLWVVVEFLISALSISLLGIALGNNDMITFERLMIRVTVDQIGLYMIPMLTVALITVTLESNREYNELKKSYTELQGHATMLGSELEAERAAKEEEQRRSIALQEQLKTVQTAAANSDKAASDQEEDNSGATTLDMLRFRNRTGDFDFALPKECVLYVETVDNYINVNYLDGNHVSTRIIRNTMKAMEEQLQQEGFIRCHRQYLVNKLNIKSISKEKDGIVISLNGCDRVVPVGKTYAAQLV